MPSPSRSRADIRVTALRPALEMPETGVFPDTEAMEPPPDTLTMRGAWERRSMGGSAIDSRQGPSVLIAMASWTTSRSALLARCHVSQ